MSDKVQMVAFRSHVRDNGELVRKGEEFEATEAEAHGYASRDTPLAGPLDGELEEKPKTRKRPAKKAAERSRKKGK